MFKVLLGMFLAFVPMVSLAAVVDMHENNISLGQEFVEEVLVQGDQLLLRSYMKPCPFYPNGIYGDLYECRTSRIHLAAVLGDDRIVTLEDKELPQYIRDSQVVIACNASREPRLIRYQNKKVYVFSGPVTHSAE